MTKWTRNYIYTSLSDDEETNEKRIVESLIALHRFREERFVEGRKFYIIRDIDQKTAIGFIEKDVDESIFELFNPIHKKVSNAIIDIVKSIVNKED